MCAGWVRRPSVRVAFLESVIPFPAEASFKIRAVRRKRSSWAIDHLRGSGAAVRRAATRASDRIRITARECTRFTSGGYRTPMRQRRTLRCGYQTRQAEGFAMGAPGLQEKAFWNS